MRRLTLVVPLIVQAVSSISCGDVVRQGRSAAYLVLDRLEGARGGPSSPRFSTPLLSDVMTNVTSPAPCTAAAPCPIVFDDLGQAAIRSAPKDVTAAPSTNNDVTISRYRVIYRRSDGQNVQGSDVPYAFDGAVTGTVPAGGSLTVNFELVRHAAKIESPLAELVSNPVFVTTLAEVTFYGRDQVGNEVNVSGLIQVNFGNFADLIQ
jgi:hypothetical protein